MNTAEKNLRKSIGKKIKLARTKSEYTQEQLAEKLSLSPRYISQLERGIAFGSASTIINDSNDIDFVDQSFLEDYIKLTSHNRIIINAIAHELVRIQKEEEENIKSK